MQTAQPRQQGAIILQSCLCSCLLPLKLGQGRVLQACVKLAAISLCLTCLLLECDCCKEAVRASLQCAHLQYGFNVTFLQDADVAPEMPAQLDAQPRSKRSRHE